MEIKVNGIKLHYKIIGNGYPLIMLHGNGESHKIFLSHAEKLKNKFTVYLIDSRGHGESSPVKSLDYDDMSEDIAQFITTLKIQKPLLYGFSDGGILGIILAYKYPDMLGGLIANGANVDPKGFKAHWLWLNRLEYFFTRNAKIAIMLKQPHINKDNLQKISIPTLILAGSRDLFTEKHTRYIADNIKNSRLSILKGHNHSSYVLDADMAVKTIDSFFNEMN